jgi:tetratricopeptide (TPR) repeat protein
MNNHDKLMADFQRLLKTQDFRSPQEAEAFMKNMIGQTIPEFETESLSNEEQAEDLVFQALSCEEEEVFMALLMQALDIDPNCIAAYECLGYEQPTHQLAIAYYGYGVELGRLKFCQKDYLKENKGHFYGIHETRPFLRCMFQYANCLTSLNEIDRALPLYKEILSLNESDNMGVRYRYAAQLLGKDLVDEYKKLDVKFEEEQNAFACFNRALYLFKLHGDTAVSKAELKKAMGMNKYMVPLLIKGLGLQDLPTDYTEGSREEAVSYLEFAFYAWSDGDDVIDWLGKNKKK